MNAALDHGDIKMRFYRTSNLAAAFLLATLTATAYAAGKPSDAQIAHIAYTAGDLDVKAAKVALEKSKNPDVRAFADNMVKDHTAVNDKALALVKKLGVTPEDNARQTGKRKASRACEAVRSFLRQGVCR